MTCSRTVTRPATRVRRNRGGGPLPISRLGPPLLALLILAAVRLPPPSSSPAPEAPPAPLADIIQGPARVIDGDTLEIDARRIRLHGIDAPERSQTCDSATRAWRCGRAATQALRAQIAGREVTCEVLDEDRYGRQVSRCGAGGEDLGAWMVAHGHALAYRRYSLAYVDQERRARLAGIGLWSGQFVDPETYRHS